MQSRVRPRTARIGRLLLVIAAGGFQAACGASLDSGQPGALANGPALPAGTGAIAGPSVPSAGPAPAESDRIAAAPAAADGTARPAASPAPPGAAPGSTPASAYKIGPHDVLDVSVFKVPELSKSVQVADTGTVNLPLVGEIVASGRTAQEVERELTTKLGAKYLQSPQVSVYVKEFNSQRVTVDGAVKKPGVFPYRSSVSLLQLIAMADGLDPNSDSTVVVFRNLNGERTAARFDVGEIRDGTSPDPAIQPGDVVVAGSSAIKSAFNNVLRALPVAGLFMGL